MAFQAKPVAFSEFVPWEEFLPNFNWQQGEHITAIGPTGSGKTTLVNHLIDKRKFYIFAATKKVDSTVEWLVKNKGFKKTQSLSALHPDVHNRYIFKPKFPAVSASRMRAYHADFFRELLMYVFRSGGWTLDLDEIRYLTEFLGLTHEYELLMLQGRSLGITVVSKTQRPRKIPLTAYDQARYLFLWRDPDRENLKRISELGSYHDPVEIRREVASLPWHEVLFIDTRSDVKLRTKVEV